MKQNTITYTLLLAASIGLLSCHKLTRSIHDTLDGNSKEIADNNSISQVSEISRKNKDLDFMADRESLQEAENLLRNRPELKGKEIRIYQTIHFYTDYRISLKIQNPDNPNYVDSYSYDDGIWKDPEPVVLSKSDDVTGNIVNLSQIPFVNANNTYKAMVTKIQEIGSKSTNRTVYATTYRNKVTWYPRSLSNERSRYSIEFNEDGTLRSFEQD